MHSIRNFRQLTYTRNVLNIRWVFFVSAFPAKVVKTWLLRWPQKDSKRFAKHVNFSIFCLMSACKSNFATSVSECIVVKFCDVTINATCWSVWQTLDKSTISTWRWRTSFNYCLNSRTKALGCGLKDHKLLFDYLKYPMFIFFAV